MQQKGERKAVAIVVWTFCFFLTVLIYAPNKVAFADSVIIYLPLISRRELPTPIPTLTPTDIPSPTPTPLPRGVYVLPNHSYYQTSWGFLHIVGEVMNNTGDHLFFVKISANLFSGNGQLLDTDYAYTYLFSLPAWQKTCFDIIFIDPPSNWLYYEFEVSYWTGGNPLPNLTVLNDSGSYDPQNGYYRIIGQVRNDHGARVEYVKPVGTLYNSSSKVVGCSYTYVNSTHLDPGQISVFEIDYYGRDYRDVASYRLQVDGSLQ